MCLPFWDIRAYLEGIYNTILIKDIVTRRKISDPSMLESVVQFMFDNIGNLCSSTKIANTLTSAGRKISVPTVENYLLGTRQGDQGHILENLVYLELLRRGYEVYVRKIGAAEVDFIAVNEEGQEYYQVSQSVLDDRTLKREPSPLDAIKDHNPKYLLTMDDTPLTSHNGIRQINALEWLLK